jgi:hypothetical protein
VKIHVMGGVGLQWQWWLLAMAVAAWRVCGIIFPCTVDMGILSVGMQGNGGDGGWVTMTATMMARTGEC